MFLYRAFLISSSFLGSVLGSWLFFSLGSGGGALSGTGGGSLSESRRSSS